MFFFLLCVVGCQSSDSEFVASLNNEPISKSELRHWMLLEKANVYNYFYRKYGVQDSDEFWSEKQGGEIPLEKLKKTALGVAKRHKIQQVLALEKGIVRTINFDEIMLNLKIVNAERKRKVENGEPIYGPMQLTSRNYFSHVFDKMVIALKTELSKDELKPNNAQLKLLQAKSSNSNKDMIGFLTMQYVDTNYEAFIDSLTVESTLKIHRRAYERININRQL